MRLAFLFLFQLLLFPLWLRGQACCSGGTPLSGTLGLQRLDGGSGLLELNYDFNTQGDLVAGSTELGDNPRRRNTHSVLLRSAYSFSDRWTLMGLFSLVRQEEVIDRPTGVQGLKEAQGIGDAVLFGQYTAWLRPRASLLLGAGLTLPIGATGRVDAETGLPLHPDLQPGAGAWDVLGGARLSLQHVFVNNLSFTANLTYRLTTPSDRYQGRQRYEFGNELQLFSGFDYVWPVGKGLLEPSLLFFYRYTTADQTNGFPMPNTGGHWLHLRPGLGYSINPSIRIGAFGEVPLYRRLEGTQLTTTARLRITIAYAFSGRGGEALLLPDTDWTTKPDQ